MRLWSATPRPPRKPFGPGLEADGLGVTIERLTGEAQRLKGLVCDREDTIIERDATIERVKALADRWDDAALLWGEDFSLAAANIYAALEPTL